MQSIIRQANFWGRHCHQPYLVGKPYVHGDELRLEIGWQHATHFFMAYCFYLKNCTNLTLTNNKTGL